MISVFAVLHMVPWCGPLDRPIRYNLQLIPNVTPPIARYPSSALTGPSTIGKAEEEK